VDVPEVAGTALLETLTTSAVSLTEYFFQYAFVAFFQLTDIVFQFTFSQRILWSRWCAYTIKDTPCFDLLSSPSEAFHVSKFHRCTLLFIVFHIPDPYWRV